MKRKALLIGNTRGLTGVQKDLWRTKKFLLSNTGGGWYENEVDIVENPRKTALLTQLEIMRSARYDYVVVLFSGHGGHIRQTILELNSLGETITESQLLNIADRQLNIYDCCRAMEEEINKSITLESLSARFSESYNDVRQRYAARIMQSIPQQICLYSCAIGQSSLDTSDGAIYLKSLLSAANSNNLQSNFKTVESAHNEARVNTIALARNFQPKREQTPEAIFPKCLTSQQLIISIHT